MPVVIALYGIALLVVAYQLYVTYRVCVTAGYASKQKLWQCVVIWLMPLVGASVAHWVLVTDSGKPDKVDKDFIREEGGPG